MKAAIDSPLGSQQLKGMFSRLLIPVVGVWLVGGLVAAFAQTTTVRVIAITIPAVVTLLALAVVVWALRQSRKARAWPAS
ncbi:MAG: hypothetical protein WDO74_16670 [Pseudomonadota bacterium]